jgi:hypothetical protein
MMNITVGSEGMMCVVVTAIMGIEIRGMQLPRARLLGSVRAFNVRYELDARCYPVS